MIDQDEDHGPVRGARGPARDKLPVVEVRGARDMAVMLARHNRLLREYARHYLPKVPDDVVEEAVEQAVEWLLAIEDPSLEHGLRYATHALWRECQRTLQRLERQKAPVDRKLGPLTGRVGRVLERLGPRQRRTILLAAQGLTPAQIAAVDNSTAASVRVRLYRARERALELLQENGGAAAFLLFVPQRVRGFVGRHVASFAEGVTPQALATTTLVPLLAASLFGGAAPALAPQAPVPVALVQAHGAVLPAVTAAPPAVVAAASVRSSTPVQQASTPAATALPAVAHRARTAAEETPDDITLMGMVTPPNGRPVVIATGMGHGCQCIVLMQSLDGGANWRVTDGPPSDMKNIVLPPDYPNDPRLFFGVWAKGGVAPYMSPAFGAGYQQILGLPPGEVAPSAHFDDGDPRLFSAAATAVWSVRIGDPAPLKPHDEVDYSAIGIGSSQPADIATAPVTLGSAALLVWTPILATVPDAPTQPTTATSQLMICPVSGACTAAGTVPESPPPISSLLVGRNGTVVAFGTMWAYLSRDGGHTFAQLAFPPNTVAGSLTLAGRDATPWAGFLRVDGKEWIGMLGPSGWQDMSANLGPMSSASIWLLAVGADHMLAALAPHGYRCTTIFGGTWASRCPAAVS